MKFTSTRNRQLSVSFSQAVKDCIPQDGGVFVPSEIEDLRRWIYYINEKTTFASIAGSLTSALIKEEYSPIICEAIATSAFPFEPNVRQLDENLFLMELFHGHTGCHRDFGVSYLCSYLEHTLQLNGGNAVLLDYSGGGLGALLTKILRGKRNIKSVVVLKKGNARGFREEDFVWNGGNIWPVEMEGSEAQIKAAVAEVFSDRAFVRQNGLTVANTTNVCRLLGQIFFFPYSFAQIKHKVDGDIFYALDTGNYGTLIAGLYSWRFALPVSGFFVPATPALGCDLKGDPQMLDSFVKDGRGSINPAVPANLERLESFFGNNGRMLGSFVFPTEVSDSQRDAAAKELFSRYGIFADEQTARAYACVKETPDETEDGAVVLTAYNHPSLSSDYCRHITGERPKMPLNIWQSVQPFDLKRPVITSAAELKEIVRKITF